MIISNDLPLDFDDVANALYKRQCAPWNNGRINKQYDFFILQELFKYMNSPGVQPTDFFYIGDLYRIHTPYVRLASEVDPQKERIVSEICEDDSCAVLPITEFSDELVAFSKNPDFTRKCYYKINPKEQAVILHCNTYNFYGIDVNAFYKHFGYNETRYIEEQEVLFPLTKSNLINEYFCSPIQFIEQML